jgi:FkbM family methyltransferase
MLETAFEFRDLGHFIDTVPNDKPAPLWVPFYDNLFASFGVPRKGVIHLGAHAGEEVQMYTLLGFRRALMVEPIPEEFAVLERRCALTQNYQKEMRKFVEREEEAIEFQCVRCAVADEPGNATFYRAAQTSLSSLARPDDNVLSVDDRFVPTEIQVQLRTLDDIVGSLEDGWSAEDFSYLRLNIQGSEMLALRGSEQVLPHIDAILLEVSLDSRYEGQPTKEEFDEFLGARGFEAVFGFNLDVVGNVLYRRRG